MAKQLCAATILLWACGAHHSAGTTPTTPVRDLVLSSPSASPPTATARQSEVSVVVRDAAARGVPKVPVQFAIADDTSGASLSAAQALSDDNGVATVAVHAGRRAAHLIVSATLADGPEMNIAVSTPTLFDGEYAFQMTISPLTLLDPKSPSAVSLGDIYRALTDPVTFILDGIRVVGDSGTIQQYGICPLLGSGPTWVVDCLQSFGKLLNDVLDIAFATSSGAQTIRQAMNDAGTALEQLPLGGVLTVSGVDLGNREIQGELDVSQFTLGASTVDFASLGLTPFSAQLSGQSTPDPSGDGATLTFNPAPLRFAYAELALGIVEKYLLPKLVPQFDTNADGQVSLAELFSQLSSCAADDPNEKTLCDDAASALATIVQDNLLERLNITMPDSFAVSSTVALSTDPQTGAPTLDGTLVLAGAVQSQIFDIAGTPVTAVP